MTEVRNYQRRLVAPLFLYRSLIAFAIAALWAVARRIKPDWIRLLSLPSEVRKIRKRFLKNRGAPYCDFSTTKSIRVNLQLAYGSIDFITSSNWDITYSDPEITTSLHRWGWLLRRSNEDDATLSREQGLALMRSWLGACLHVESFRDDPYSAGERIVNGSLFLLTRGDKSIPNDIQAGFKIMARQIVMNLEYYEGERTGNHAFNNARALFFAGVLVDVPQLIALALAIFKDRLEHLVTSDGFLREGSSHYHFLFTRWILEVHWLSVRNRIETVESLVAPYARKLVERCWFFLVWDNSKREWNIPLIGDISPDFPPTWLLGVPWSNPGIQLYRPPMLPYLGGYTGWASLFGLDPGESKSPKNKSLTYPSSHWYRIQHGDFTLFVYAETIDGRPRADHRHLDLGGFVLFRSGSLIFTDSGRIDYTNSLLSNYGRSADAHNTVLVDGLAPSTDTLSWFQKRYKSVNVEVELIEDREMTTFRLRHNGFSRLAKGAVGHERRFILRSNSFRVEDELSGSLLRAIRLRFHLGSDLGVEENALKGLVISPFDAIFEVDERLQKAVLVGQKGDPIGGVVSSQYGVLEEGATVELNGELALPATIVNSLNWC